MFIVKDIHESTVFEAQTRKEIGVGSCLVLPTTAAEADVMVPGYRVGEVDRVADVDGETTQEDELKGQEILQRHTFRRVSLRLALLRGERRPADRPFYLQSAQAMAS
jgi:hypothetical protein